MEDVYGLFQLPPDRGYYRRKDFLYARWTQPRLAVDGADQKGNAADGCARHWCVSLNQFLTQKLTEIKRDLRLALRLALVRPGQGYHGMVGERSRGVVHVRTRRGVKVLAEARHGSHLPRTSGS